MGKSQETKKHLLETASTLFNTKGYQATSISDITFASGFTKGAIYKHFDNKSTLELAALEHMCTQLILHLRSEIKNAKTAPDKLKAVFQYYVSHVTNPMFSGGCPVLNASVEIDDTQPDMKHLLNNIMHIFHESIKKVLENGIRFKQLSSEINTEHLTTLIITSLEGAIMMSKLSDDTKYIKQVYQHLMLQIDSKTI